MIRTVIYLLVSIFLLTFLRYVIGIIGKAFSEFFLPPGSGQPRRSSASGGTQAAGELKRDPVCGTYVAITTSLKKTVGGEVIHFCSAACRDKYKSG